MHMDYLLDGVLEKMDRESMVQRLMFTGSKFQPYPWWHCSLSLVAIPSQVLAGLQYKTGRLLMHCINLTWLELADSDLETTDVIAAPGCGGQWTCACSSHFQSIQTTSKILVSAKTSIFTTFPTYEPQTGWQPSQLGWLVTFHQRHPSWDVDKHFKTIFNLTRPCGVMILPFLCPLSLWFKCI